MLQFGARVDDAELPVDPGLFAIALLGPGRRFRRDQSPALDPAIQWHSFSGFCHSVKDSVLGLGYPLIFYSVSGLSLPVFSFLAATFRSVFGIAAHRTYPDGAVADTGRSRQQYEPRFPGERRHAGVAGSRCWPPPPQVRA